MSKSFTSAVLFCCTALCCGQSFGQNAAAPDGQAGRKVTGAANDGGTGPLSVPVNQGQQRQAVQGQAVQGQVVQGQGMRAQAGITQHDLAALLTICNQGEVDMSKIGVERAKHDDVKKFAEEMVKAHTEMLGKIQQADAAHAAQANANNSAGTVGRRAASVDADSPIVSLHREIAAQCAQSTQEELGKKEGAEFDKCFMGAQLGAHMHAIDSMKVFQRHATGELRQVLDEGVQAATSHLEHAKGIMKSLETAAK